MLKAGILMAVMRYVLLLAFAVASVDWWAVRTEAAKVEGIAKPLVMVVLIVAVLGSNSNGAAILVAIGLCCSLLGDLLLLPSVDRFIEGLGAFFVGHLFFIAGFVVGMDGVNLVGLVIGLALSVAVTGTVGRRISVDARRDDPMLYRPVQAYIVVLAAMLAFGQATGVLTAAVGSFLFATSDAVLGWHRFVSPIHHGRFWTHVPYHLGQGLIALWAIGL